MDLAFIALVASLAVALCQSGTDLSTKAATREADDRAILAVQWLVGAVLLTLLCLVIHPGLATAPAQTLAALVKPEFWTYLAWSGTLNVVAHFLYIRAFRLADASLVAPLVLLTPVMMLVTSPLMTGEQAPPMGMIGVVLTVVGVGLLDSSEETGRRFNFAVFLRDPGARMMLTAASIWSITANLDKLGVLASTPLIWIDGVTIAITLCAIAYWAAARRPVPRIRHLRYAVLAGGVLAFGNSLQMWALTVLFTPYIIAIKRLSALFTVLASGHVLKEETGGRLLGAAVMLAGAVMIAIARG